MALRKYEVTLLDESIKEVVAADMQTVVLKLSEFGNPEVTSLRFRNEDGVEVYSTTEWQSCSFGVEQWEDLNG